MLVHAPTQSVVLNVPDPFAIRALLAKSKTLDHPEYNLAVKHTVESTRVLRNMGFDVPAPIRHQYDWPGKYKPFDHQVTMAEFLTLNRRAFNLSEMGTGKTAATLWAADWLMKTGRVQRALILSPLSTIDRVWRHDIFDVLMHRICSVVHGNREKREAALKVKADFYVVNHDGVQIKWLVDMLRRRDDIDLVIVDEGSMFRNGGTKKYKNLSSLIRPDQRLWWITGTPCPNEPVDAWAQAALVNPSRVPKYMGAFRRMTMIQESQFKWAPRPDAYKIAYEALQPAVRFKKAECLDLPPVMYEDRQCEMSPEQKAAFKAMRNQMAAEAKDHVITAVNAADKINKLRQILCGSVKDPATGDYVTLDHSPRTAVLKECIEQASAKVIVVVPFKGIIKSLERELKDEYGETSTAVLNGDVSVRMRDQIIHEFKAYDQPRILLCHPKVMSHGLNLTEADVLVFYAPIYSNDEATQVVERFNRAGQTRKMTVIKLAAHPIEWEIYKIVDGRAITQASILNLYKQVTEG